MQQFRQFPYLVLFCLGTVLTCSSIGCSKPSGPQRAEVFGKLSLDGTPVPSGSISFIPDTNSTGPSAGALITDGNYQIKKMGPMPGKYRVQIQATHKTGKMIEAGTPSPPGTMIEEIKQYIPEKFNTRTELLVEIKAGRNTHNFELTSK
jgi:hypothetical protein